MAAEDQHQDKLHGDVMLFNRWSYAEVQINDISVEDYHCHCCKAPTLHTCLIPLGVTRLSDSGRPSAQL